MQYRTLPGTDLSVSLLGFGNFVFGTNWWGEFTDEEGVRLQNRAVELGVNFFDTAAAYGNGRAERLLARTIAYAGRDNLVISSKFGYDFYTDTGGSGHRERRQDFSPAFLRRDLEGSLGRLEVETIDLYQAHNLKRPDFRDELFETLDRFVEEGKIREWGVALGPAIGWREEGHEALAERGASVVQTVFNLYEQDPGRELLELAETLGRGGVIARVPTNSGILDEEFESADHVFPSHDHRKFRDRDWLEFGLAKNEVIRPMARSLGCSLRELAFRWLAAFPALVSIEPNILSARDLATFARAADAEPVPEAMRRSLEALYGVDFHLGPRAHPCDLKSSIVPGGSVRSAYQPPPEVARARG